MDQSWGIFKVIFSMNLVLLWFVTYVTLSSEVLAHTDFFDSAPEDDIIEELQRRIEEVERRRFLNNGGPMPELRPGPAFTYQFPERSLSPEKSSTFAVNPSDPRYYYEESQSLTDNPDSAPNVFSRQSKSDEDYEVESTAELNPESQTLKTSVENESRTPEAAPVTYRVYKTPVPVDADNSDLYFIAIVAGCSAAAVVGVIVIGISWYKLQKNAKAAADVEYPAYGVTGPNKEVSPTGDRRLAQSAQMYHYQHQKQQIIAMESRVTNERNGSVSEAESEEENEEGDYTVYECPGLASTGEMEVKNPLFQDDPTPATPAVSSAPTPATEKTTSSTADGKK
ncbi:neural proliferation differentiation and control protein 1 isoform X2 [Periplaneta americana]|uniref:neural proliferation differentiation and control protein 1 isoform X2 n=1 Tax=Periplaneta americana TaxID=6978 RepID=UPI0037E750BA